MTVYFVNGLIVDPSGVIQDSPDFSSASEAEAWLNEYYTIEDGEDRIEVVAA